MTKLKITNFGWRDNSKHCCDSDKLLCDVSSIQSISNSNHTLESIDISGHELSSLSEQCLKLKNNGNKATVIRSKILLYYFVGEFDVSPFVDIALSVLPEGMSQVEGENNQSAIYRLPRCIPELCNVSGRGSCEQPGNIVSG
jgi:hypothetical protein